MGVYFVCVLSILLRGKIHKRVHTPSTYQINDCIYNCLVNGNQLLGDAVPVILLVIPRYLKKYINLYLYSEPLYLAHLRSLFGPYSLRKQYVYIVF